MKLILILILLVILFKRYIFDINKYNVNSNVSDLRCILSRNAFKKSIKSNYRPVIYFPKKLENRLLKHKLDFYSRWQGHEDFTHKYLVKHMSNMKDDEIIIDAGCHVGDTGILLALILKQLGKRTIVYEIDPDTEKLEFINKMAESNNLSNIRTIHCGLSNKKGKGSLEKKKFHLPFLHHSGATKVKKSGADFDLYAVDYLFENHNVGLIHFDLEGYEYDALLGSKKVIDRCNPIILIEISIDKKAQSLINSWGYKTIWKKERNTWNIREN